MSEAVDYVARARGLQPLVRECADEAERDRRLPKRLVEAMAAAGLYRVAAPASVGGGETEPGTQIRVIEAISEADGAAGWTLMIGIEAMGFLGAALPFEVARRLYADSGLVVAGALNPLGSAQPARGGYKVSGQWPFASGCDAAQFFWGQCVVYHDRERVREDDGRVKLVEVVLPREDFEILDTWHVSGLRGSGSHDVRASDVFVPEEMTTAVSNWGLREKGPLFRMPPFSRLAYNKVGVATGIARAAIEHFKELAQAKVPRASTVPLRERLTAQLAVAEAETELGSARAWVFDTVGEVWSAVVAGSRVSPEQRARVQLACSNACSAAVRAVDKVHCAAGTTANFLASPLERCFRDVQVVRQHITVSPQWFEAAGRVLLGLDSGSPLL